MQRSRRPATTRRWLLTAIFCLTLLGAAAAPASAAWPPTSSSEDAVASWSRFPATQASVVTFDAPLPAGAPAHPAACDKLKILRMRHIGGPADPSNADAVLTMMPGILEGASAFENIGRNLITRAKNEHGKYVEVWAIDRRANCLEDLAGLDLARTTHDAQDLLDYYYAGAEHNGDTFDGFLPSSQLRWVAEMGLDQTLRDWNTVLTRGIPSQPLRKQKLFCGGHSLGGILTGEYLTWDADGNAATTADAGYNQCAGTFALDSFVTADPVKIGQLTALTGTGFLPDSVNNFAVDLLRNDTIPRVVDVPGINPEVMYFLTGVGFMADEAPAAENTLLPTAPETSKIKMAQKLFFSRDYANFVSQFPDIRDYRFTNRALLGTFMDDNSFPLSFVQASAGFYKGGSVSTKDFPTPDFLVQVPLIGPILDYMVGGGDLAIPTNYGWWPGTRTGPLYDWMDYDEVTTTNVPRKYPFGPRFTSPSREVTDINDLAHGVAGYPLNFVEAYYPTRMILDASFGLFGSHAASPNLLHPNGFNEVTKLDIAGSEGVVKLLMPIVNPNAKVVNGYNHIDVLTAAPVQNNGQPEPVATHLLDYVF